jgi:hypothetical protein
MGHLWCGRQLTNQQPFAEGIATLAYDRTSVLKCAKSKQEFRLRASWDEIDDCRLT